ncbi:unnamed protein product [Ambrosiozyma monospora]|uniref:Unnamed protein product n=1 Tax=Ambrosiozyma monospora TaxID=43982 RepID=A0A9W6YLK9_AMBMO|nr:unnamed protein product [Ambrosiozyma monospora]
MPDTSYKSYDSYIAYLYESGTSSDVQVKALGTTYELHSLLLKRSPYFKCLIEWNKEKNPSDDDTLVNEQSLALDVEIDDPLITKDSFELMLKRLYGIRDCVKEKEIPAEMIATAFFFQMEDIKESMLEGDWLWNSEGTRCVIRILQMADSHDYGKYDIRLMNKCMSFLLNNGWQSGFGAWFGIRPCFIPTIVNIDEFFVPNEFERIMFAVNILQDSKADDDEIDLAITKFRESFSLFTLTYPQQLELLKQRLPSGKIIFDLSSLSDTTILATHIQYSTTLDKSSPIPSEDLKVPQHPKFKQYFYEKLNTDLSHTRASTIIPPFRLSIMLNQNSITKLSGGGQSYHLGFAYCGSTWIMSLYHYIKSDQYFTFDLKRVPDSKRLSERYAKPSSTKVPFFRQSLEECNTPNLPLSHDVFESEANFHDWRDVVPVYSKISFESENGSEFKQVSGLSANKIGFSESPFVPCRIRFPKYLQKSLLEGRLEKPIKMNILIGAT